MHCLLLICSAILYCYHHLSVVYFFQSKIIFLCMYHSFRGPSTLARVGSSWDQLTNTGCIGEAYCRFGVYGFYRHPHRPCLRFTPYPHLLPTSKLKLQNAEVLERSSCESIETSSDVTSNAYFNGMKCRQCRAG